MLDLVRFVADRMFDLDLINLFVFRTMSRNFAINEFILRFFWIIKGDE